MCYDLVFIELTIYASLLTQCYTCYNLIFIKLTIYTSLLTQCYTCYNLFFFVELINYTSLLPLFSVKI